MSRSYKRIPICKDNNRAGAAKTAKHFANSKVRKYQDEDIAVHTRSFFKKISDSYDIHDYISYWTKEDAISTLTRKWREEEIHQTLQKSGSSGYYHNHYPTLENCIQRCWYNSCKRK